MEVRSSSTAVLKVERVVVVAVEVQSSLAAVPMVERVAVVAAGHTAAQMVESVALAAI